MGVSLRSIEGSSFVEKHTQESGKPPGGWSSLREAISFFWLSILTAALLVLAVFGTNPQQTEDLQIFLFPVIALGFYGLIKNRNYRAPLIIVVGAIVCSVYFATTTRGLLQMPWSQKRFFLSRLDSGVDPESQRKLYRGFGNIAETEKLPPMSFVERKFNNQAEASAWLHEGRDGLLLLWGNATWVNVVVSPRAVFPNSPVKIDTSTSKGEAVDFEHEAAKLFLDFDKNLFLVEHAESRVKFALVRAPESFTLPVEPLELSRDLLVWFGRALQVELEGGAIKNGYLTASAQRAIAEKRSAFLGAARLNGAWKSNAGRSAAYFFAGTLDLIVAAHDSFSSLPNYKCAQGFFARAAQLVRPQYAPALFAALLNNWAVAETLHAKRRQDFEAARTKFIQAIALGDEKKSYLGSRTALLNLMALDQSGLLEIKKLSKKRSIKAPGLRARKKALQASQ